MTCAGCARGVVGKHAVICIRVCKGCRRRVCSPPPLSGLPAQVPLPPCHSEISCTRRQDGMLFLYFSLCLFHRPSPPFSSSHTYNEIGAISEGSRCAVMMLRTLADRPLPSLSPNSGSSALYHSASTPASLSRAQVGPLTQILIPL